MGALQQIIATDPRAAQQAAAVLKTKGKGSDTELAHINPRELRILRKASGRAVDGSEDDINPATGVPMFDDDSDNDGSNTSSAGENTGGMDGSAASGSGPGSGPSSSSGGDSSGQGIGGGIGYGGDVGYSPGNRPDGFRSEDTINETETSAASRAGTSTADDYAGMGPDKANALGLGWNEYSEQTTGALGSLNRALGNVIGKPTMENPNATFDNRQNVVGAIGGMFGPIGSLAASLTQAIGLTPEDVSVAGGTIASQIGSNFGTPTAVADGMAVDGSMVTNSEAGPTGADTTNGNNAGEGALAGRTTVAGATPAEQAADPDGMTGLWDPVKAAERNAFRSTEAGKYINDLRQRWGFDQMQGSRLSSIVAGAGQFGDSQVAMLSPEAQARLKAAGGVGTRNPATGMPQFYAAADVAKAYKEVLGREGDAAGVANWTQSNPNGTYQDLVNEFKNSGEYKTNQINGAYQSNLGRTAETGGLNTWMGEWDKAAASGADPYAAITAGIKGSDEYKSLQTTPAPTTPAPTTPAPTTPAPTTPPAATPAPQTPDYASFMKDFMTQLQGILKPAATTPAATTPAATSPLQNVSTLTPVRVPRFRSRRYAGYIAPNFSS